MKTRGRPFQKGQSGNPAGRKVGARTKAAVAADALFEGEAEALTREAIELAKAGDTVALRMCMDRISPARRDRAITFTLPEIVTTDDLPKATQALLKATAAGEITPSEAAELGKLVDAHVRAIEVTQVAARLQALEEAGGR